MYNYLDLKHYICEKKMKVEFYKDSQGEWRWNVKSANGEITGASSEGFATKQNASANLQLLAAQLHEQCLKEEKKLKFTFKSKNKLL